MRIPRLKIISMLKKAETSIRPEDSIPLRQKKRINAWQVLLLLLLLWLAVRELKAPASYFFPSLFLLALWGISQKRQLLPEQAKTLLRPLWHPVVLRLRTLHIKLIRGQAAPPVDPTTCTCLNCGTTYEGNYCHRCGQSRDTHRYRLSNALKNIAGGFFNIDRGFGRTLIDLLYRPGYLIHDFIGGKRAQYFRPFQTLFILAALYIMAVQLIDPDALNRKDTFTRQELEEQHRQELAVAQKKLRESLKQATTQQEKEILAVTLESLEKSIQNSLEKQRMDSIAHYTPTSTDSEPLDKLTETALKAENKTNRFLQQSPFLQKVWNLLKSWAHGNKAFRIIATLPLFALATQLAFRRRKFRVNYNTTEHIFIQAYIACQILLLSILALPFNGRAEVDDLYELPLWLIFFLFCWDYKQLYRYTWWRSFWRTILMLICSLVLLLLFACLVMALILAGAYILK